MPADLISINYEQAKSISGEFQNQTAVVKNSLHDLDAALSPLRAGKWQAESASTFYKFMDESLMQGLQRLHNALEQGSATVSEISVDFQKGDADAMQCFPTS